MFYAVSVDFVRGRRQTVCNNVTRYVFCLGGGAADDRQCKGCKQVKSAGERLTHSLWAH